MEVGATCWLWDPQISLYAEGGVRQFSPRSTLFLAITKTHLGSASFGKSFSSGDGFRGEQGHRRDLGGGLFPEGLGTWDVMVGFYILQASRAAVGES